MKNSLIKYTKKVYITVDKLKIMCYNRNILRVCITFKKASCTANFNIGTLKFGFKAHKGVLRKRLLYELF